jgi:hypothetical protein
LQAYRIQEPEQDVGFDSLDESIKIFCHVLYSRDFNIIKETLVRIQVAQDLSRLHASYRRLLVAVASSAQSRHKATELRKKMSKAEFDEMSDRHRRAFMRTPLFQTARPFLEGYHNSRSDSIHRIGLRGG